MKIIMTVLGCKDGKEFRHDLHLPSVPISSYEDWIKAINDEKNSKVYFESIPPSQWLTTPTPDFVRAKTWYACETEKEVEYYNECYKGDKGESFTAAYRGFIKSEPNTQIK